MPEANSIPQVVTHWMSLDSLYYYFLGLRLIELHNVYDCLREYFKLNHFANYSLAGKIQ